MPKLLKITFNCDINGRFNKKRFCSIENLVSNTSYRSDYLRNDAKKLVLNQDAIDNVSIACYFFVFCITVSSFCFFFFTKLLFAAMYFIKEKVLVQKNVFGK